MKQTAVEWLYDRFLSAGYAVNSEWKKQAIEMEKQQIGRAYQEGLLDGMNHTPKDYYNETFNTNDK
jgi:hypothetical protein